MAEYCQQNPVRPAGAQEPAVLDALVWLWCTSTHSPAFLTPHQRWPGGENDPGVICCGTHAWPDPLG